MKKSLFLMASAAAIFAACTNETLVDNIESPEVEIGFSTIADPQTKAENNGTNYTWNLEDHHGDFDVWSTKQVASNYVAVHGDGADNNAGVKVTYNTTDSKWVPASKKYWDKAATQYLFYAAAPSSSNWKITNASSTTNYSSAYLQYEDFTLAGTNIADATYSKTLNTSWKDKADKDLMIAAPCTKENISAISSTSDQTVTLQFNHILSRLNVAFKKSEALDGAEVVVTAFSVNNIVNKGSFDESDASAVNAKPGSLARWTPSTTNTDIVDITGVVTTTELSKTDAYYTVQSLIIPQTIEWENINRNGTGIKADATAETPASKPYIYVAYTIDDEPYYAYVNLAAAFGATADNSETTNVEENKVDFTEGWQNNLTVTLDALEVLFDATVAQWSDNLTEGIEVK